MQGWTCPRGPEPLLGWMGQSVPFARLCGERRKTEPGLVTFHPQQLGSDSAQREAGGGSGPTLGVHVFGGKEEVRVCLSVHCPGLHTCRGTRRAAGVGRSPASSGPGVAAPETGTKLLISTQGCPEGPKPLWGGQGRPSVLPEDESAGGPLHVHEDGCLLPVRQA